MTTTDTPKTNRKWWRIAAWLMGSTLTLLILTLAAGAWWLWGWQSDDELTFHESWSNEERAALTELNTYLHNGFAAEMKQLMEDETGESSTESDISTAIMARTTAAPIAKRLAEIAASGSAADAEPVVTGTGLRNYEPSIMAAQTGHFEALKALIAHGANPNATLLMNNDTPDYALDTPLSPLLSGNFAGTRSIPWEQRREMVEYLLQHGAELNDKHNMNGTALKVALIIRNEAEPWLLALKHGKKVSQREFIDTLLAPAGMPVLRKMIESKQVNVNDNSGDYTPLQSLAEYMCYCDPEELDQGEYEARLDMLLAAGANPNIRCMSLDACKRTPVQLMESRTNFECADGMPENSCCTIGPDIRTRWQNMCDKLRAAGTNTPAISTPNEESSSDEEDNDGIEAF